MRVARLIPPTLVGPVLIWIVFYWWFMPDSMRLPVPASFPSNLVKITAIPFALMAGITSKISAEAFGSCLSKTLAGSLYKILCPIASAVHLVAGLLLLSLFSSVIGLPSPSPHATAAICAICVLHAWLKIIKDGIALHVKVANKRNNTNSGAMPLATELLENDRRPPIIYLRSFHEERLKAGTLGRFSYVQSLSIGGGFYMLGRRPKNSLELIRMKLKRDLKRELMSSSRSMHDEQMLFAECLGDYGPYIAIGRPGESFENMDLGASKLYVSDEKWRDEVLKWINVSAAIVLEAAGSEGILWEIEQVIKGVNPRQLLVILPRNGADYHSFCMAAKHLFPNGLPDEIPPSRLIIFGENWTPVALDYISGILEDTLEPFLENLAANSLPSK